MDLVQLGVFVDHHLQFFQGLCIFLLTNQFTTDGEFLLGVLVHKLYYNIYNYKWLDSKIFRSMEK